MSEHKETKWLYTFTIPKDIEVEKQEESEVNGEKVTITRKVKEKKEVKFALKRPNRRLYERADLFYGVQLAEGVRAGLLTKALLLKRYKNDGGALSESETKYFNDLIQELTACETDINKFLANLDKIPKADNDKRIKDSFDKKIDLLNKLQSFESLNKSLFSHTAEAKAEAQVVNWWTVFLSYWDEKDDGNYVEYFTGESFEDRMKHWDELYDKNEDFLYEVLARLSILVNVWLAGAQNPEDFQEAEKQQMPQKEEEKPLKEEEKPVVPAEPKVETNAGN